AHPKPTHFPPGPARPGPALVEKGYLCTSSRFSCFLLKCIRLFVSSVRWYNTFLRCFSSSEIVLDTPQNLLPISSVCVMCVCVCVCVCVNVCVYAVFALRNTKTPILAP